MLSGVGVPNLVFGSALLVSYVLLFYNYHLTGRKALLYYALAWVMLSVNYFVPRHSVYVVGLAFFTTLVWLGNLKAAEELLSSVPYSRELKYFSIVPVAALIFLFPENPAGAIIVISGSLALSGVYLLLTKNSSLRIMGAFEIIFSAMAFLRVYHQSSSTGFIEAIVSVMLAYVSIRTSLDSSFLGDFEVSNKDIPMKSGVVMMESVPEDVLEGALVLSRIKRDSPNWFWITTLPDTRAVSPTNLPKMMDMAVKFMKRAKELGSRGVVIIDGLEYLILENGFESVVKFLSTLRDYAILHDSVVIIVGDDSFLDERQRRVLRKLLE